MINIMFAGNGKVFDGLLIAAHSIVKYNGEPITVYVLTMDLREENPDYSPVTEKQAQVLDGIYKAANAKSEVVLLDATEYYKRELRDSKNKKSSYTPYAMTRLFADRFSAIPDKLLYLDTDVVLRGDIAELYGVDVTDYELAGVLDHYGSFFINEEYINTGVLLLNMKKIRESGLFQRSLIICKQKRMLFPDQSALNKCVAKKLILPRRFNEQKREQFDTLVRHFSKTILWFPYIRTKNVKPWQIERLHGELNNHEYDDILEKYLKSKKAEE